MKVSETSSFWLIVLLYVSIHIVLHTLDFSSILEKRIEISTPASSFLRVKEGYYLYKKGIDPYEGVVFFQSPFILLLHTCLSVVSVPNFSRVLYPVADIVGATALRALLLCLKKQKRFTSWSVNGLCSLYLLNPLTIAASVAGSSDCVSNALTLIALYCAVVGSTAGLGCSIALVTFFNPFNCVYVLPLFLIAHKTTKKESTFSWKRCLFIDLEYTALLLLTSYLFLGSWKFLISSITSNFILQNLSVSLGLWWYFFIEIFETFRSFFLFVFAIHPFTYTLPVTIRLRKQPLTAFVVLVGVTGLLKSYPSIADLSLFVTLIHILDFGKSRLKFVFLAGNTLLYSLFLGPAFFQAWIYLGSGNANFFYAITLVYALAVALLVSDILRAALENEFYQEHPEFVGQKLLQVF
ncbi:pig-U [Schizosaccharomyces japonicus yFS275]|uniref:Pig-U n=1 Tax=Schizosaccharomyces japonicus (strain yFS275 / FY16936) TaxID=402676 RepID=B6K154_SCHJY|nr:pig-U [Schizosaccharomyces japonicus yFS275]EEB07675.1 pig-U [Schizosaccharomyces japonicus yFS275]